jgi:predicted RNase H-like HicB family nuclease
MDPGVTYPIVIEEDDGEFVTYVPALDFASTYGDTREEALERTRELIVGYLETAEKDGIEVRTPVARTEITQVTISRP